MSLSRKYAGNLLTTEEEIKLKGGGEAALRSFFVERP